LTESRREQQILKKEIINEAKALLEEIINWRRTLHQIPEIGFDLFETSAFVKTEFDKMGIKYSSAAKTGVVALIEGAEEGPTLALRADMDALPIREETGLPFASLNGNMHACGHDAHAAMLLGAAKIIKKNKARLKGNVKLLFQPGEEGYGGAELMIKDGCLEDPPVSAIYGLHVGQIFPEVKLGQVGICDGPILAAATAFSVEVKGQSTHGALPHLGVDSILVAAEIVVALQKIVSRELNPLDSAVLTIGKIEGGEAINIVTPMVKFSGDFRTLSSSHRDFITERITAISKSVAAGNRAEADVKIMGGYPPTLNNSQFANYVRAAVADILGNDNLIELVKPNMGTEDMSLYLDKVPGAFFVLGTGNPQKGITYPHHNSRFDLDESALWIGPALFTYLTFNYLS